MGVVGGAAAAAVAAASGRRPQPQRCRQVADRRPRERAQPATGAEHGHREQVCDSVDLPAGARQCAELCVLGGGERSGYTRLLIA